MNEQQQDISPDPELVAREIRACYIAKRSAELKKPYRLSARHDKKEYWMRAAELCIRLKANPKDFIDAVLEAPNGSKPVFANMLFGNFAENAYKNKMELLKEGMVDQKDDEDRYFDDGMLPSAKLCLLLKFALNTLYNISGTISMVEKNLEIMRSPFTDYHPAVRVLLAYPDHIVMERYGEAAKNYFQSNPGTLEIVKKMQLPVDKILSWQKPTQQP